jgi:hypothetical protein
MLALAFLAVLAATAIASEPDHIRHHDDREPAALTVPEIRRLHTAWLTSPPWQLTYLLRWSNWRRHHQAEARHHHYRRRLATEARP